MNIQPHLDIPKVRSFDIFDTTLTRVVSRPTAVFLLVAAHAAVPAVEGIEARSFARLRVEAERAAERNVPGGQPTLDEIYASLQHPADWSDEALGELKRCELNIEQQVIRPIPATVKMVADARNAGSRILFLSDMYLPSGEIKEWLRRAGVWQEGDSIYLSGEIRASKRAGTLYQHVIKAEGVDVRNLTHTGDNPVGDFESPRRLGIRSNLVEPARLNCYEELLDGYTEKTVGASALLAGTSRLARLNCEAGCEHARGLQLVACSVAAPILAVYTGWVLNQAKRRGIRRLYFVSRDGYVLKDFANKLASSIDDAPEIRYLFGGRQAWRAPALSKLTEQEADWIFEPTAKVTIRGVFERMGSDPEVAESILLPWGYPRSEWQRSLKVEELNQLKVRAARNPDLERLLGARSDALRQTAISYLSEQGLLEDVPWAIVDLGWRGSLQSSLSKLLRERGRECRMGFYFGLEKRSARGPTDAQCAAFAFDYDRDRLSALPVTDLPYLLESFCSAPHGTVTGYRYENGRHVPEFRPGHEKELVDWGLETVHDAYKRYLDIMPLQFFEGFEWASLRDATMDLLRVFSESPGPLESSAWGRFPYENDQNAALTTPLARPQSANIRSLLHCMNVGEAPRAFIEWQGGARGQASQLEQCLVGAACALGRAKAKLGRILKRRRVAAQSMS